MLAMYSLSELDPCRSERMGKGCLRRFVTLVADRNHEQRETSGFFERDGANPALISIGVQYHAALPKTKGEFPRPLLTRRQWENHPQRLVSAVVDLRQ